MSHRDFREFLAAAEQRGLMRRVTKAVDRSWEPACFAKWAYQALPDEKRFGILYENVEGSEFQLATGVLGASTKSYALALGVEPGEINAKWLEAYAGPIPPTTVETAPCQEVVRKGNDVNLSDLPIPTWTPGKDAAPYITTITMTRSLEGEQNMAVYRTLVRDDKHVVCNLNPVRHGYMQSHTWLEAGKPAPIAWVIGPEPAVYFAAVANVPYGYDEMTLAGGLKGAPVELVKCVMSELMVPANSEIIIEGEIIPGEMDTEGPFGEMLGYMSTVSQKPVVRITAITHRKDAIYYGLTSQMPPSESTVIQSKTQAATIFKTLRQDLGETSIHDVHVDLCFGGINAHGIVSMTPRHKGHAKRIGRLVATFSPLKRITIVDRDIDIRDPLHIDWAMNARYLPDRDTVILDDIYIRMNMDSSMGIGEERLPMGSKIVFDATQKGEEGVFSLPNQELMDKALASWKEAGLPDFDIPKRAKLRFERA